MLGFSRLSKGLLRRAVACSSHRARHAAATDPEAAMPTPLSLGHSLVYHAASMPHRLVGRGERRPVIVIGGWLGAKPHQLKAYQRFYHDRGCDTLSFAVGPQHVLLPDRATALMERVLERCLAPTGNEARPPPAVAFHMFSVGGYCFGQMLRVLESRQRRFAAVPELISAQVFDSPPDIAGIAKGEGTRRTQHSTL